MQLSNPIKKHLRGGASVLVALSFAACGGAEDPIALGEPATAATGEPTLTEDETAEEWGEAVELEQVAIAEIELSNGDTLGWYEFAPGAILVGQSEHYANGPQTDFDPALLEELTPTQLYHHILPDAEVPTELIEAEHRAVALARQLEVLPRTPVRELAAQFPAELPSPELEAHGLGQVRQAQVNDSAYPWSAYQKKIQCNTSWAWHVRWPHSTSDNWFRRVDNDDIEVGAGVYAGEVSYQVRVNVWSWETPVSVKLKAGEGWRYSKRKALLFGSDFDVESKVHNAAGDGFHHCGAGIR